MSSERTIPKLPAGDARHLPSAPFAEALEFAVVAPKLDAPESAIVLASSIARSFSEPFSIGSSTVSVGVSIGIALCPAGKDATGESLLCSADRALYRAKTQRE